MSLGVWAQNVETGAQDLKAKTPVGPHWMTVPRVRGHLSPRDLGLVINTEDPYSVEVGGYYAKARNLGEDQILRVSLPIKGVLSAAEFEQFRQQVDAYFGDRVQALALAWRMPYGVECNSLPGALAMGFDPKACANTCSPTRQSRYFGSSSVRPYKDFGMRISMLLASQNSVMAKALIDRGVKADATLGRERSPLARVHFVSTSDNVRSVRRLLFPPPGKVAQVGLEVFVDQTDALKNEQDVLIYLTGKTQVEWLDSIDFLPGALADHLTSYGGI